MQEKNKCLKLLNGFWFFPVFSGILHFVLLLSHLETNLAHRSFHAKKKDEISIKLKIVKSKNRQVVETTKSLKKLRPKKDSFLGKENNSFTKQTRANTIGSFQKAGYGSPTGQKEAQKDVSGKTEIKSETLKFSDLGIKSNQHPRKPSFKKLNKTIAVKGLKNGQKGLNGESRSSDFVDDIPLGDFTKLNTQEFQFYGFYHRIKQKLEQFWGANLREEMEKVYKSGRSIASGQNYLTSLVIKMNSKGEIVKIQLNSTSGIQELDEIAISSFNEAGPFPNPPKKMLKNGLATIKWGFAVTSN